MLGLRDRIAKWRDRYARIEELDAADAETLREIASEFGLSVSDFREIVMMGEGADALLADMMDAHGVAAEDLRDRMPAVMRDIEIICARCGSKNRCSRELANGTAAGHASEFCPNAPTFEALR